MMRRIGATALALATLWVGGCGESRPDRLILEYPGFAFQQTFEKSFDWLVVDKLWGAIDQMPPLTVDFGDGAPVKLQDLSEDWIEQYKSAHPEDPLVLDEQNGDHYYKARSFHIRFLNGKLYSLRMMSKGKVINQTNEESVTLPTTEAQVRAAFGAPKEVHKLRPLN